MIRTLDNPREISLIKFSKDLDAAKQLKNSRTSDITIDGLPGKNFLIVTNQGKSFYCVEYYPDLKDGKTKTYVLVAIGTGLKSIQCCRFPEFIADQSWQLETIKEYWKGLN